MVDRIQIKLDKDMNFVQIDYDTKNKINVLNKTQLKKAYDDGKFGFVLINGRWQNVPLNSSTPTYRTLENPLR